ncbi:hypothetical protein JCM10207_003207, partial [Rhodosporidiobolus poonsookiae]
MDLSIAGTTALKTFTRTLLTLARLAGSPAATDIDFTCTPTRLSLSVVNPSRTAFGVAHFYPHFFAHYHTDENHHGRAFKFAITAKALLSALRPRTSSTVESVSLSVSGDDPGAVLPASQATSHDSRSAAGDDRDVWRGECRVVVKLYCQHGVVKTHRLTYSNPNVNNWAKFDKDPRASTWVASGRVLKE